MSKDLKVTIIVNRYGMGVAPEELSLKLLKNYFTLINDEGTLPTYLCFYGDGVKLTLENSPVIEELLSLDKSGVKILICKTCLLYNNAIENVRVGNIATMLDIIGVQNNCDKVIVL